MRVRAAAGFVSAAAIAALLFASGDGSAREPASLDIPAIENTGELRPITLADIDRVREIGSLSLSPDGSRFAIFVRQGDVASNRYRSAWYVGDTATGDLRFAGDGGEIKYDVRAGGHIVGEIESRSAVWSPDGRWIAYPLTRNGETQIWRSRFDGRQQRQVTSSDADIVRLFWDDNSEGLWFETDAPRRELSALTETRYRQGHRYDDDLFGYADYLLPQLRPLDPPRRSVRHVALSSRRDRIVGEAQSAQFLERAAAARSGRQSASVQIAGAVAASAQNQRGGLAWLRMAPGSRADLELAWAPSEAQIASAQTCASELCRGLLVGVWWSSDGATLYFWRRQGLTFYTNGIYALDTATGAVRAIASFPEEVLRACDVDSSDRLICIRETPTEPAHVAAIDLNTGAAEIIADVNPEFASIRLGRVERIEWDVPRFAWQEEGRPLAGFYPERAYGHIYYPPDYDPSRTYPVFIEPYAASGFNSSVGKEHALHVYAANGFIVLNMSFPLGLDRTGRYGGNLMGLMYAAEDNYPHLSILAASTLAGLDAAVARGAIDETRVGIGGVSHGTFVPLQIMQRADRIAAISVSSATWGPHEYASGSARVRVAMQALQADGVTYRDWRLDPATDEGRAFWHGFDVADHVAELEGPVLINAAASETYALVRLIRYMSDRNHPYDAYIFADETHLKWQPAHLSAIRARNLDWFRFWLEDIEDPDPLKAAQYETWRRLRDTQCRNPRTRRNYCTIESERVPLAQ